MQDKKKFRLRQFAPMAHPQEGVRHEAAPSHECSLQQRKHLRPVHRDRAGRRWRLLRQYRNRCRTARRSGECRLGEACGRLAAEAAKSKGITEIVFDRTGARYHGKVKALADAAREAGLKI